MWTYPAYVLMGLCAGFASAMLGIGGGVIMVPMLILLFAVPAKAATATSLAYIAPVAFYGAVTQWYKGHDIRWLLVLMAVPAGLVGAHLGIIAKKHVTDMQLKVAFGLLMVLLGARLALAPWMGKKQTLPVESHQPTAEATEEMPTDAAS